MRGEGNAASSTQFFVHSSCLLAQVELATCWAGTSFPDSEALQTSLLFSRGCFVGISYQDKLHLLRLWYHENCRVFRDRLVSKEDQTWFDNLMMTMMEEMDTTFEEVVPSQPVLFGDFMEPGANIKLYKAIDSQEKVRTWGIMMLPTLLKTKQLIVTMGLLELKVSGITNPPRALL